MSEPKHTPRHRWTSHYYRGGAEAAMREEAALKRAFQSFHGRANQFARATDEMALLEQEKAELLEALEFTVEVFGAQEGLRFSQRHAINKARAAIAKAKGETE